MAVCNQCGGHGVSFKEVKSQFSSYSFKLADNVCTACKGTGAVKTKEQKSKKK